MWKSFQLRVRSAMWIALIGLASTSVMAIEEPSFKLVGKSGRVELREYSPYLVAETRVRAEFADAGNLAFGPLFNYISGKNQRQEKIDMTAPVSQSAERAAGEKIAMTAPVTQAPSADGAGNFVVGFTMPARYNRDNIPQPTDARVSIREVPSRTMAVLAYSGTWSMARYAEHEATLREEIVRAGWVERGAIEFARYDPPMMPWFLRRNEVMVEVEPRQIYPK